MRGPVHGAGRAASRVLDGVSNASGFALFMEWGKVIIGPGMLIAGASELFRLYLRSKPPGSPSPDHDT